VDVVALNLRRGVIQERIKEHKLEVAAKVEDLTDFNNLKVCITGTIPGRTRTQAQNQLKKQYPFVTFSNSITKSVNILVTGFGTGQTKFTMANRYGIKIVDWSKVWTK
jgi:NAD-dependent DNA ligase